MKAALFLLVLSLVPLAAADPLSEWHHPHGCGTLVEERVEARVGPVKLDATVEAHRSLRPNPYCEPN